MSHEANALREMLKAKESELAQLKETVAFVHAQIGNGCEVDMEPCYPEEYCQCLKDAKTQPANV